MHYLWLFHSRNGLVCTHAKERRGWREKDWNAQDKSNGKHTWMRSKFVSQKTMLLEQHAGEGTAAAASVKCLQRGDRQYLTAIYTTVHDSHPSAKICSLFLRPMHFGYVFITYHDSSAKWLTMLWFGCIWIHFLYWLWLKYKHAKVISVWKGESIRQYRLIGTIQRLN